MRKLLCAQAIEALNDSDDELNRIVALIAFKDESAFRQFHKRFGCCSKSSVSFRMPVLLLGDAAQFLRTPEQHVRGEIYFHPRYHLQINAFRFWHDCCIYFCDVTHSGRDWSGIEIG